jgi:hypothetical protein
LYALIADIYSTVGVYTSINEGVNWTAMNNTSTEIVSYQGWYAKGLCVKADEFAKLLFGGVNVFSSISAGNNITQVSNINFVTDYVHSDIHGILSNPLQPKSVYVLTDGGLFRSDDFGVSYYECTDGYVTSQFYIGSVSYQDSLYLLGGAQDNYTDQYTGTVYWLPVVGGDGSFNAIDHRDDHVQYCSYQYLNVLQSTDRGANWNYIFSSASTPTGANPAAFIAPFILCPSNENIIYAGSDSLHKSIDRGISWVNPSGALVDSGKQILTIAASATNPDSLYFATAPSDVQPMRVFRSVDGGVTLTDISAGLPNRYPRDITVNPDNSRELYIVYSGFGSGHIFKSTDAGVSWADLSSSLPDIPFHTLMIEPGYSDTIFAGSDLGVFASYDGGTSWTAMNSGFPDGVMVFDLQYSPLDNSMVAFTHGNGVYKVSLNSLPLGVAQPSFVQQFTQQVIGNPVHDEIQLAVTAGREGKATIAVYDVSGKKIKDVTQHHLAPGKNLITLSASSLTNGTYFLKTEFSGEVKVNKFVVMN